MSSIVNYKKKDDDYNLITNKISYFQSKSNKNNKKKFCN